MKNKSKRFGMEVNVATGEVTQVELPEVIDEATPE
jgi:hypothetical protein